MPRKSRILYFHGHNWQRFNSSPFTSAECKPQHRHFLKQILQTGPEFVIIRLGGFHQGLLDGTGVNTSRTINIVRKYIPAFMPVFSVKIEEGWWSCSRLDRAMAGCRLHHWSGAWRARREPSIPQARGLGRLVESRLRFGQQLLPWPIR